MKLGRHAFKPLLKISELFLPCAIAIFQEIIYDTTTDREGFQIYANLLYMSHLICPITLLSDPIIVFILLMRRTKA